MKQTRKKNRRRKDGEGFVVNRRKRCRGRVILMKNCSALKSISTCRYQFFINDSYKSLRFYWPLYCSVFKRITFNALTWIRYIQSQALRYSKKIGSFRCKNCTVLYSKNSLQEQLTSSKQDFQFAVKGFLNCSHVMLIQ